MGARIKIAGRAYEIPTGMTIGESRKIKEICGLNPSKFQDAVNRLQTDDDPNVALALIWWAAHRTDPTIRIEDLESVDWEHVGAESDEPEVPVAGIPPTTPPPSNANETSSIVEPNGSEAPEPATTLERSGVPG